MFFVLKIYYIKLNPHWLKLCYSPQINEPFPLPLPNIIYAFWIFMNLKFVVFPSSIVFISSFLVRILLWSIFVSKHRWTHCLCLLTTLGVELRWAVDMLCDLGHPFHLIRISKNSKQLTFPTCLLQLSGK